MLTLAAVPEGPAVTQPNSFSAAAGVPEGVETAIWSIGAGSHPTVSPVWINSDGSAFPYVFHYLYFAC